MSDIDQFLPIFLDETEENIQAMEQGLLGLDLDTYEKDEIDSIFRAAHSIKGSAGMFNFTAVASFTHVMETFLDQFRNPENRLTSTDTELLFRSVDSLKDMLEQLKAGQDEMPDNVKALMEEFEALMSGEGGDGSDDAAEGAGEEAESADDGMKTWHITFVPEPDLMQKGTDPASLIQGVEALGDSTVTCLTDGLPEFDELDPEQCYLKWEMTLTTDADYDQIDAVFSWCAHCEYTITEADGAAVSDEAPADEGVEAEPEPEAEDGALSEEASGADENDGKEEAKDNAEPAAEEKASEKPAEKAQAAAPPPKKADAAASIRVDTGKIDYLIDLVGELVITQSMIAKESRDTNKESLISVVAQLNQNMRELQEGIMTIRMLPIAFAFNRFPRLVRDLSVQLKKNVVLKTQGEKTEIDKTVMEKISDPMVHLVRNAIDHGIEMPDERREKGKPDHGQILLNAYHSSGNIVIEISDDGAGINAERVKQIAIDKGVIEPDAELTDDQIYDLIFAPGFSTAEAVSDVSGRGVGMDVVRRNIHSIGGSVDVTSTPGHGSKFTINLPLTLAILDGQLFRVGQQLFIIPMLSIVESMTLLPENLKTFGGHQMELYNLRNSFIPIVRMYQLFGVPGEKWETELTKGLLILVERAGQKVGLFVDDLLEQQQVVIKSLESNYQKVPGVSGATVLGDGRVALIIDVDGICRMVQQAKIRKTTIGGLIEQNQAKVEEEEEEAESPIESQEEVDGE